jgi:hypothetical protein
VIKVVLFRTPTALMPWGRHLHGFAGIRVPPGSSAAPAAAAQCRGPSLAREWMTKMINAARLRQCGCERGGVDAATPYLQLGADRRRIARPERPRSSRRPAQGNSGTTSPAAAGSVGGASARPLGLRVAVIKWSNVASGQR